MMSDHSTGDRPKFSNDGNAGDQRVQKFRAGSPVPSCVSMKSDHSTGDRPKFSNDGNAGDQRSKAEKLQNQQRCGVCEELQTDPVSITCGHSFCRQCISRYWNQSAALGDFACPQCRKRFRTRHVLYTHTAVEESMQQVGNILHRVLERHKTSMKNKYESLFEGITIQENKIPFNRIYTQLYIIEGESEGVNEEHEVLLMEKTSSKQHLQDTPINCLDIFKPLQSPKDDAKRDNISISMAKDIRGVDKRKEDKRVKVPEFRTVLSKGIAGIGKTVSVQKFILDWAEGAANQDVDFMFVLPFKEMNLIKDAQYSLHQLLCDFHPEMKDLDLKMYNECKLVFIFDGLDESRIPLNFSQCERICDVSMTSSVGMLMSNLIKGELLPSAHIWITSRPAAANQIPPQYINRVTEIQGFNDPQKEEYFRKRISDQDQAQKIISHIKTAKSLHIMCHIPVFCWISATVLQKIMKQDNYTEIPKTLTEMYTHFLLTQINLKQQKYESSTEKDLTALLRSNREMLLKLSELAFKQLKKGNVMFYEEELRECGIDVTEASVYSGICTEILKEESVLYQKKVYCFVHLSFQEFLAAFYVFQCYVCEDEEVLNFINDSLYKLLEGAVDKALKSQNGYLDLFLRFLLGISVESNQKLLQGLLTHTHSSSKAINEIANYIKQKIKGEKKDVMRYKQTQELSIERTINLFLCLTEMKEQSLSKEIQEFIKSEEHSEQKFSTAHCSAIAYMMLMSEEVLDEFDMKKFNTSEEGYRRLVPAVSNCRKALLTNSHLGEQSCEILRSVLQSAVSSLRELDLSNNDLQDSGVKLLSVGLKSSDCKLEILRLSGCLVTEEGCSYLAAALSSNPSHLKELDLNYNHPGDSGVKLLSARVEDPHCRLQTLRLEHAGSKWLKAGPRKYVCELTLDPNTAHTHLSLSEENRKVLYVKKQQDYPDHPERFDCVQVMCRESLTGRCYWESEWSGDVHIAVTYRGIKRKENSADSVFGRNINSWRLSYCDNKYFVCYNNYKTDIPAPLISSNRVGVYLDCPAGTLSFYSVSTDTHTLTHLHTFHHTFTEPLYAGFGFGFWGSDSSVCLCQIE